MSADWCQPCQTLGPIMEQVKNNTSIPIQKINVDYEPDITKKYGVKSVPTVILIENNQEIRRFVGAKNYNEIINFINK